MLSGLQIAWDMGFRKVILECDSKALIVALKNGRGPLSYLVQVIGKLLKFSWEVKVIHTYREGNSCVGWFANYSLSLKPVIHKLHSPLLIFDHF